MKVNKTLGGVSPSHPGKEVDVVLRPTCVGVVDGVDVSSRLPESPGFRPLADPQHGNERGKTTSTWDMVNSDYRYRQESLKVRNESQ